MSKPTQADVARAVGPAPEPKRGRAFKMFWDNTSGCVQVVLPSMTRINFSRESAGMLWSFCNAATLLHERDPKYLSIPLTQKQIDDMRKQWIKDGNCVIKPLEKLPQGPELQKILAKAMEGLKL